MASTKPALTPITITDKLADLYLLNDTLLHAEANLIRLDFNDWLEDNFDLTVDQSDYLDGLPTDFMGFLADMCYIAVKNRLEIDYTPLDSTLKMRASKILDIACTFSAVHPAGSSTGITGKLFITAAN
jgi:hypothetical protein